MFCWLLLYYIVLIFLCQIRNWQSPTWAEAMKRQSLQTLLYSAAVISAPVWLHLECNKTFLLTSLLWHQSWNKTTTTLTCGVALWKVTTNPFLLLLSKKLDSTTWLSLGAALSSKGHRPVKVHFLRGGSRKCMLKWSALWVRWHFSSPVFCPSFLCLLLAAALLWHDVGEWGALNGALSDCQPRRSASGSVGGRAAEEWCVIGGDWMKVLDDVKNEREILISDKREEEPQVVGACVCVCVCGAHTSCRWVTLHSSNYWSLLS